MSRFDSDRNRTLAFLAAAVLRKFGSAIWIPVLLAFVTPADFSRYGMLLAAINLMVPLLSLGLVYSPARLAFDYAEGPSRDSLFRTVLFATIKLTGLGLLGLLAVYGAVSIDDPLTQGSMLLAACVAAQIFAAILSEYAFSLLRVDGLAMRFAISASVYALGPFLISLPFLWLDLFEPLIVISGSMAIGLFGSFAIAMYASFGRIVTADAKPEMLRSSLHYSVPVSLHLIGLWAINASGRWIGTTSQTLDEMASFTLLSSVAALLMGFPTALLEARLPKFYTAFGEHKAVEGVGILRASMRFAMISIAAIYLMMGLFFMLGSQWISSQYVPSLSTLVCFLVFNLSHCQYLIGVTTLSGLKRTSSLAMSTLTAGSLSILISYFGCRHYGEMGLVAGMLAGMFCQALMVNAIASIQMKEYERQSNSND